MQPKHRIKRTRAPETRILVQTIQQYKGFFADSPNVRLVLHVRLVAAQSCLVAAQRCGRRTNAATNRSMS